MTVGHAPCPCCGRPQGTGTAAFHPMQSLVGSRTNDRSRQENKVAGERMIRRPSVERQCVPLCQIAGKKRRPQRIRFREGPKEWRISPRQRRRKPWPAWWSGDVYNGENGKLCVLRVKPVVNLRPCYGGRPRGDDQRRRDRLHVVVSGQVYDWDQSGSASFLVGMISKLQGSVLENGDDENTRDPL